MEMIFGTFHILKLSSTLHVALLLQKIMRILILRIRITKMDMKSKTLRSRASII